MLIICDNFKGKKILLCKKLKQAKCSSMENKHVQRSAGVLLFKFSCHISTSNPSKQTVLACAGILFLFYDFRFSFKC